MNTLSTSQDPSGQPAPAARRPRRPRLLRRAALAVTCLAGIGGRGDELAAMASIAGDAATGRARVVWIEGEAGSGKTALLRAALGALPAGFTVLAAEADELAGHIPFYLAHELGAASVTGAFPAGLELLEVWSHAQESGRPPSPSRTCTGRTADHGWRC